MRARNADSPAGAADPQEPPPALSLRGDRHGVVLSWERGDPEELIEQLRARLEAGAGFYRGGTAILDVGELDLEADHLSRIGSLLSERGGMKLSGLVTESRASSAAAREAGVQLVADAPANSAASAPWGSGLDGGAGILLRRTLRSGQRIEHPGHVVVIGDVNPGAEISAGGDVVVWGKLKGVVHAGARGDSRAVVCALELAATQLRIGSCIAVAPDQEEGPPRREPEAARVEGDRIVVEPWE